MSTIYFYCHVISSSFHLAMCEHQHMYQNQVMHTQLRFYLSLQRILHELKSTICLKSQQFRWLQTAAHIPIFLKNTQPAASKALIFTITHFHTLLLLLSLFLPLLPVPLFLSLRHVCYFPLPANFLPWMLTTQVENVLEMGERKRTTTREEQP